MYIWAWDVMLDMWTWACDVHLFVLPSVLPSILVLSEELLLLCQKALLVLGLVHITTRITRSVNAWVFDVFPVPAPEEGVAGEQGHSVHSGGGGGGRTVRLQTLPGRRVRVA